MPAQHVTIWQNDKVAKLLEAMLDGTVPEIKPKINPQSELGFSFPTISQILDMPDKEIVVMLKSLVDEDILVKRFFDKFLHCPQCGAMNLRPVYSCPKCSSGNTVRGRMLEHPACGFISIEDEFFFKGRLLCPKCKRELQSLSADYRSLGVLFQCRDCREVFNLPAIKWSCLKCSSITAGDKIIEVDAYSYFLNSEKRNWLQFELKPKQELLQLLRARGYEVSENATVKGTSGADHLFDLLATRDDGVVVHNVVIGVEVADKPIGLDRVFNFDQKVYDVGFHDKLLIAIPGLAPEAGKFASRQTIRILGPVDLGLLFMAANTSPGLPQKMTSEKPRKPFHFESKAGIVSYLQGMGYEVKENAKVKGKSGAGHIIDILAMKDDKIVRHNIAIGIEVAGQPIGVDRVFAFDVKAYDCSFLDKVLIAIPGLTPEASRFAQTQRIRVFQARAVEPAVPLP